MKHRRSFLAAARGRRVYRHGLLLQGRCRVRQDDAPIQVGYTASRRVGGAVVRNRAKRRMRAAVRLALPHLGKPGWDYVLVARAQHTVHQPFAALTADLAAALREIHRPRRGKPAAPRSSRGPQ